MNTEKLITNAEAISSIEDIGAAAMRALPPGRRHRYRQAIRYTLQDGGTEMGTVRGMTKPQLKERISSMRTFAQAGKLHATYERGTFYGTTLRI